MTVPAARRLRLSAQQFRRLIDLADTPLPPEWALADVPIPAHIDEQLLGAGVLVAAEEGESPVVHPSVLMNLRLFTAPMVMVDTTVSVGDLGSRSLHVLGGELGASLFLLTGGSAELSMYAAVSLGQEFVRAVPEPPTLGIGTRLGGDEPEPLPTGVVPLRALHEAGVAQFLTRGGVSQPGRREVLDRLDLAPAQAELVRATIGSDGGLQSVIASRTPQGVISAGCRLATSRCRLGWAAARTGWQWATARQA
jgi:hypothetical protein